jgi:CoA:oxalate CoA-transferase
MMSITGDVDGEPCRVGASIGDIGASLFTTIGILSGLQQRNRTGKGSSIDVAMLDCQLALMENAVARVLNAGETPRALGSRHPLIAPFQAFPTADRPIAVCIDSEERWSRLCEILGLQQLAGDPRLGSGPKRNRLHAEIEPVLKKALLRRSRDEWLVLFDEADIPASAVNSVPEAVADPQVLHRQMVVAVPAGSNKKFSGVPIHMDGHAAGEESPAPKLGEHNNAILGDLGFAPNEIAELARDGVI